MERVNIRSGLQVSADWTVSERKMVSDAVTIHIAELNELLIFLRAMPGRFLEVNREKFQDYVVMPAASVKD
jgi:hypothetical protein